MHHEQTSESIYVEPTTINGAVKHCRDRDINVLQQINKIQIKQNNLLNTTNVMDKKLGSIENSLLSILERLERSKRTVRSKSLHKPTNMPDLSIEVDPPPKQTPKILGRSHLSLQIRKFTPHITHNQVYSSQQTAYIFASLHASTHGKKIISQF
ncbi:hypothetical protein GcC1_211022 [Golovinomyces cichoracearum]|uniref:Uncharacterized protein n=1 Tax=Golovinomyces cichoracearum TaxID=62708 RepID=A0A420HAL0_9PEZI|nr:hypothetical protein GcC1_211022 [Golovinomyces cichoracearum]